MATVLAARGTIPGLYETADECEAMRQRLLGQ
jgi:hypothetical protein